MGNDFQRLLNPVDQSSHPSSINSLTTSPPRSVVSAASHYPSTASSTHAPLHGNNRQLPVISSTLPPREGHPDSRFGPSQPSVHDPSSISNSKRPATWSSNILQSSITSSNSSRDGPASSEPRLDQWSQQQLSTHSAANLQSTTSDLVAPKESRSLSVFPFGIEDQGSVPPVSNKVKPTTPPSPSPSPLQTDKSVPSDSRDSLIEPSTAGRLHQPQIQAQREPRSVRFEDPPRNGPSSSPRFSPQSCNSPSSDERPLHYDFSFSTGTLANLHQPTSGSEMPQRSPIIVKQEESPPRLASLDMNGHTVPAKTSPQPADAMTRHQHVTTQTASLAANGKCQRCEDLETASYTALGQDISAVHKQKRLPPATIEEFYRNADQLLSAVKNQRGKLRCEECRVRDQMPHGTPVRLDIETNRRERRKSSPLGSDFDEGPPRHKRRKGDTNGLTTDAQTPPEARGSSTAFSPSPKCQSTPPPENGSASSSSNIRYEISTVNGESITPFQVGGHMARLLSNPSRSTRPSGAAAASSNANTFQDPSLSSDKEKQRKDSGPAPTTDGG